MESIGPRYPKDRLDVSCRHDREDMKNNQIKRFGLTDVLILLAVIIWGVNMSFVKMALREFSPQGFNGLRLILTSCILLLLVWARGEGLSVKKRDFWPLLLIGIIGNTLYQILFIEGINRTTASNTSLILSMTPVFVAVISTSLRFEKIHWAAWMGIGISFIGLYMIFLATIFWAAYTVFSKPFFERISPLKFTAATVALGTIFYLPVAARDILAVPFSAISIKAWGLLFFSSVFALVFGVVVWYYSVKRIGNSKTAIYNNLTPVFSIIFASIFLFERISPFQILGALIILSGVYMTRSGYRLLLRRESRHL
jgi:drug/metabolite transporter (DMT)-like permease